MKSINQAGLTFIEVVIAGAMMSIIGLIIINFFTDNLINYHRSESQVILQSDTKQAADTMSRYIRSAQAIEATNSIADANQTGGWTTDGDTLVLATPSLNSSGEPIYTDSTHNTTYTDNTIFYVSGNVIFRRVLANPNASGNAAVTTCPASTASPSCPRDSQIVDDIATLVLDYDGSDPQLSQSVELTITRIRQMFSKTFSSTVTAKAALRNR